MDQQIKPPENEVLIVVHCAENLSTVHGMQLAAFLI